MAKKKWTKAEKAAFAQRMKKARAKSGKKVAVKKHRKVSHKTEVSKVTKKKSTSKKGGATHRKPVRHHRFGGMSGSGAKGNVMHHLQDAAIAIGGGVVASAIANKLPIQQPLGKAVVPAVAGLTLLATQGRKNHTAAVVGTGMLFVGALALVRAQFPAVPLLAGEEEAVVGPMGYDQLEYQGAEDISGVDINEDVFVHPGAI